MSVLVNLCFFVYIAHRKDRARQVLSYEPQTEITKAPTNALSGLTAGIAICEGPVKGGHPGGNTTCVGIFYYARTANPVPQYGAASFLRRSISLSISRTLL